MITSLNKMTNRQMFRGAPTPSSGPISNDLPRPVPVVPVAKPRGKIQPGAGPSHSSGHPLRMGPSQNNNNNNTDSNEVDIKTNGNHSVNPMKSIRNVNKAADRRSQRNHFRIIIKRCPSNFSQSQLGII